MAKRFYGLDVRDGVKTFLTTNYNTMIGTINIERTMTVPVIASFITGKEKYQFPEMYIDITGSNIPKEEIFSGDEFNTEIFTMEIKVAAKETTDSLMDHMEVYTEALIRLLDNITLPGMTSVMVTSTIRGYYDNSGQVLRTSGVNLEIRVN